jgi:hypothetical protein
MILNPAAHLLALDAPIKGADSETPNFGVVRRKFDDPMDGAAFDIARVAKPHSNRMQNTPVMACQWWPPT